MEVEPQQNGYIIYQFDFFAYELNFPPDFYTNLLWIITMHNNIKTQFIKNT